MAVFFRSILKISLIFIILFGYMSANEIKGTDSVELLTQGKYLIKKGQYKRAIVYFNKAMKINPRYAEAYYNRSRAFYYLGHNDKAISDLTKAIEIKLNVFLSMNL